METNLNGSTTTPTFLIFPKHNKNLVSSYKYGIDHGLSLPQTYR